MRYFVPDKYTPEQAWPLVVALHGYGDNAAAFHDLWKSVTDSLGFVLLTPQGEERTQEGFGWAWGSNAERAVQISIDIVRKVVHVDPKRIYLTGFSLGGSLCYVLVLNHPQIFRGIAPLGAPFDAPFDEKLISENTKRSRALGAFQKLRVLYRTRNAGKQFFNFGASCGQCVSRLGRKSKFGSIRGDRARIARA